MMSRSATISIVLLSDDEIDNNDNNNDPMQTQSVQSTAQMDGHDQVDTKPIVSTINQLQAAAAAAAAATSYPESKPVVPKQPLTTTTTTTTTIRIPEEIDLTSPMKFTCDRSQRNYLPYTLTSLNQERLSILPTYPPKDDNDQPLVLLLTNIPNNQLSPQERTYRQQGTYKCSFSIQDHNALTTSFMVQQYNTYYESIMERFNVDLSILDYNYLHLKKFIRLCQAAYIRVLPSSRSFGLNFNMNEKEFPQLLEFYLQIDVDLFYMKTCSFRQAKPRKQHEGIFCTTTPECRYVMAPCNNCSLCYAFNQANNRQQYSVTFNLYQKHRFVNGYESILNCPALCSTNNIIYALTCQCGHYDYIGETSGNLLKRLSSHQCFTHRLILETLIGEKNYVQFWGGKSSEMIKKDSMRLYQHPKYCSSVIQSFLNQNLDYWIFIPILNEEADQENNHYQSSTALPTTNTNNHSGDMIQRCLDALPRPPNGYKFSKFQIKRQHDFFTMKHYQTQPNMNYTVYNTTMIAVLPLNTSDLFRHLVHSLLITHAETKLNTLGHIFSYPGNVPINQSVWCANLRRPPPHQLSHIYPKN